jgi:hypothetical protein
VNLERQEDAAGRDRRRDRRLTLTGQAVLRTLHGRTDSHGGLVDVSASGLRFRLRPTDLPEVGAFGAVDVRVVPAGAREAAAAVRLTGFAEVLRVDQSDAAFVEVAVRFLDPLSVREAFEMIAAPVAATWS